MSERFNVSGGWNASLVPPLPACWHDSLLTLFMICNFVAMVLGNVLLLSAVHRTYKKSRQDVIILNQAAADFLYILLFPFVVIDMKRAMTHQGVFVVLRTVEDVAITLSVTAVLLVNAHKFFYIKNRILYYCKISTKHILATLLVLWIVTPVAIAFRNSKLRCQSNDPRQCSISYFLCHTEPSFWGEYSSACFFLLVTLVNILLNVELVLVAIRFQADRKFSTSSMHDRKFGVCVHSQKQTQDRISVGSSRKSSGQSVENRLSVYWFYRLISRQTNGQSAASRKITAAIQPSSALLCRPQFGRASQESSLVLGRLNGPKVRLAHAAVMNAAGMKAKADFGDWLPSQRFVNCQSIDKEVRRKSTKFSNVNPFKLLKRSKTAQDIDVSTRSSSSLASFRQKYMKKDFKKISVNHVQSPDTQPIAANNHSADAQPMVPKLRNHSQTTDCHNSDVYRNDSHQQQQQTQLQEILKAKEEDMPLTRKHNRRRSIFEMRKTFGGASRSNLAKSASRGHRKLRIVLYPFITSGFLLATVAPYWIYLLICLLSGGANCLHHGEWLYLLVRMISVFNPFCPILTHRRYRREVKEIIGRFQCRVRETGRKTCVDFSAALRKEYRTGSFSGLFDRTRKLTLETFQMKRHSV